MINYINHIEVNPEIMFGKPCIKGTRVPVDLILRKLKGGYIYSDLLDAYPRIKEDDILACIECGEKNDVKISQDELENNALKAGFLCQSKAFLSNYYENTEGV